MNKVEVDNLDKALQKIDTIEESELQTLLDGYAEKQKPLVTYILATCESFENSQNIASLALYYYAVFYESFVNAEATPKAVTDEDMKNFLDQYMPIIENPDAEAMSDKMLELIQQDVLFSFLINEIVHEDDNGVKMGDDEQQQIYILGTIMIGMLNQGANA